MAKSASLDLARQVAIGGGDDSDIDLAGDVLTHPLHLPTFEHAKHARLQIERQFADFVDEDRAFVGGFESALALCRRPSKGALRMAKQLGLDEILGDRSAVDHHVRASCARTRFVHCFTREFLAGAGLAQNEHRRVGRGDLFENSKGFFEGLRARSKPTELMNLHLRLAKRLSRRREAPKSHPSERTRRTPQMRRRAWMKCSFGRWKWRTDSSPRCQDR